MSCLFDALGERLDKDGASVRKEIVEYLKHNHDIEINDITLKQWIEMAEEKKLDNYLQEMSQSQTWGGFLEIIAASNLYDSDIIVRFGKDTIRINDDKAYELTLNYNGSHYY